MSRERRRLQFRERVASEIAEIDLRQLAEDLHGKDFRDAYLDSSLCWLIRTQVRLIREDRGWSIEELVEKSGVSFQTIQRLENLTITTCAPKIGTLLKLAEAFDCALIVRFEAWSQYLAWLTEVKQHGVEALIPRTFPETMADLERWAAAQAAAQPETTITE